MGDTENHGITWPLNWLIGNASNEHVLFLEKDFQLVEPIDCVYEQLAAGKSMLDVSVCLVVCRCVCLCLHCLLYGIVMLCLSSRAWHK